jgi:hypothetical protein
MHSPLLAHLQRLDLSEAPIVSFQLSRSDIGFPEPAATLLSIGMILLVLGAFAGLWRTMRQPARHARA